MISFSNSGTKIPALNSKLPSAKLPKFLTSAHTHTLPINHEFKTKFLSQVSHKSIEIGDQWRPRSNCYFTSLFYNAIYTAIKSKVAVEFETLSIDISTAHRHKHKLQNKRYVFFALARIIKYALTLYVDGTSSNARNSFSLIYKSPFAWWSFDLPACKIELRVYHNEARTKVEPKFNELK